MIRLEVTARNFQVDDKLKAYALDKIGSLERYLPRHMREAVGGNVVLEDDPSGREDNRYVCEVVLNVHGETMVSREGTVNMYAAIDIVEAKLKSQLTKFKDKHTGGSRRGRLLSRWIGRGAESEPDTPEGEPV